MKKITLKNTGYLQKPNDDKHTFVIDYEKELNEAQFKAASAEEGAYLIIAGAGTGKTRTLVFRVAYLVERGNDPRSILLLTFTRKAAAEMLNRAAGILDERCSSISGGTFHSFANLMLRRYAKAAGLDPNFTILDQGDSEDVVNLVRPKMKIIPGERRLPDKRTLYKLFSLSVNTGLTLEQILIRDYPHFYNELDFFERVRNDFTGYKRKHNMLDYDDLLVFFRDFLFSMNEPAKRFLDYNKFVMVDEYQDTNKLQSEIVQSLTQIRQNIMVVGDDAQAIYSFRGADFRNIMQFPQMFPNVTVIPLEENYRSTQPVLDFANRIHRGAIHRYEKNLFTKRQGGEVPIILAANNELLQSRFIVERILDLKESGISLNQIAVLFRSSFFSFNLEIELNKANIPFIKVGGIKFVETAHIKDVMAFLRIVLNPTDAVSWHRVLLLHEGIGARTADKIVHHITEGDILLHELDSAARSKAVKSQLLPLFELLHQLVTKEGSPTDKAGLIIDYYIPLFQAHYDDYHKRKKDLDVFLNITQNYRTLSSLLSDMAIEPPLDSIIDVDEELTQDEYLTLSTIHSAKGLEWHSVFVIHALDGFFPSSRSMFNIETLEEERRLMYVAVTRAKTNLFVTYPMNIYDRESGTTLSKRSRFLNDIDDSTADICLLE